jgi:hypothetical protein
MIRQQYQGASRVIERPLWSVDGDIQWPLHLTRQKRYSAKLLSGAYGWMPTDKPHVADG